MSEETDLGGVRDHFARVLEEHGSTARGVDYRDEESQRQRFARFEELALDATSVCDLGCGVGALLGYLRERGFTGEYVGVDLVPASIALARRQYPGDRFEVGSEAVGAAVVVASGIFNARADIDDDEWSDHIRRTLASMWSSARRAIAFNVLSRSVSPHLFSVGADVLLDWVGDLHPGDVSLTEDVGLGELTVIARRAQMA